MRLFTRFSRSRLSYSIQRRTLKAKTLSPKGKSYQDAHSMNLLLQSTLLDSQPKQSADLRTYRFDDGVWVFLMCSRSDMKIIFLLWKWEFCEQNFGFHSSSLRINLPRKQKRYANVHVIYKAALRTAVFGEKTFRLWKLGEHFPLSNSSWCKNRIQTLSRVLMFTNNLLPSCACAFPRLKYSVERMPAGGRQKFIRQFTRGHTDCSINGLATWTE